MSEYDEIDALTGGKAIESTPSPEQTLKGKTYSIPQRIKPAKEQKFQGGNSASKISADPQNETVGGIIHGLDIYKETGDPDALELARKNADASPAPRFDTARAETSGLS